MTDYAIRVSRPYTTIASWISSVALLCDKMVVVEHNEGVSRVHCHVHAVRYHGHTDTLTNTLEKALNIDKADKENRGNKLISKKTTYGKPKKPVDDGNISYISKGKYDPLYMKGYTVEEYTAFKAQGYDKKDYWEGEKESPDAVYYRKFEAWFHTQPWAELVIFDGLDHCNDFSVIKNHAFTYAIENNQFIFNTGSRVKFQMLVWTYSFRHNVRIPADERKWQI